MNRPPVWATVVIVVAAIVLVVGLVISRGRGHDPVTPAEAARMSAAEASAEAADARATAAPTPTITAQTAFGGKTALPAKTDAGQALDVVEGHNNQSGFAVTGGLLVHGAPLRSNAASYLEASMGAPVTTLGAEAVFNGPGGDIALISWQSSIGAARNQATPQPIPNGGVHFVASATDWHLGIWIGAETREDVIAQGAYGGTPLRADGATRYQFQVIRQGSRVWVTTPVGTSGPYSDPRFAQWSGAFACWELYEYDPSATPAAFSRVWAG